MAKRSLAERDVPKVDTGTRSLRAIARESGESPLEFNRLIHEQTRLGIVSALAVNRSLSFQELKRLLGVSDGNLSVHARKLEEAGYVSCLKSFSGRLPKTVYRLTLSGKRAFVRYLDHMEALIRLTRES